MKKARSKQAELISELQSMNIVVEVYVNWFGTQRMYMHAHFNYLRSLL